MRSYNLMLRISFLCVLVTLLLIFIVVALVFLYHFVHFLIFDDHCSKVGKKHNVGYFLRNYKFNRIRVFTISDYPTSPNRVWVNPSSRCDQSYQYDRYGQSSQNDRRGGQYDDYAGSYNRQYNNNSTRQQSHRSHQKENSAPQSSSSFSFTKALEATGEQSSLQQRVKPPTSDSAGSSFSFVKALQNSNRPESMPSDSELYSKVDTLSKEQKTQFENSEFTWGKIPLLPPCAEYC